MVYVTIQGVWFSVPPLLGWAWASPSIYSQEWYVRQAHENLLKNSLSHTVAESHTFAKVYWKNTICPTLLLNCTYVADSKVYRKNTVCLTLLLNGTYVMNTKVYWKNMICPTLLLNGTYVANTKFYLSKRSALHAVMYTAMSETRGEKTMIGLEGLKKHQKKKRSGVITSIQRTQTIYNSILSVLL